MKADQDRGRYVRLGRSGTWVSRLWLGTVNFSGRVSDDDAIRLMDAAIDRGINCIDTADIYGWRIHKGHTEELVGRWLARSTVPRDDVILATKVGEGMSERVNDRGLSARHIVSSCEDSLRRLGTDHIDLYQMHRVDRHTPWDEVWQAMDLLVASGKVSYVGSSNFAGWHLAEAQERARRRHSFGIVSEQCLYNLSVRFPEMEIIPSAEANGIGVFAWSPLGGGLLSGMLRKLADGTAVKSAQGRAQRLLPELSSSVEAFEKFSADAGENPAEIGLAWVLAQRGISGAVIGPRDLQQLDSAARAQELELSHEDMAELDNIFAPVGYGGPAPEAWLN